MSKQSQREEFIARVTREGLPLDAAWALLRAEATLHRLAELECSSEAADRDRVKCPAGSTTWARRQEGKDSCLCRDYGSFEESEAGGWHGTVPRIAVQGAKVEARVLKLLHAVNDKLFGVDWEERGLTPGAGAFGVRFNGDPRGAAILLQVPSGGTSDWGGRGVAVP